MLRKYAKKLLAQLSFNDYQTLNLIEINQQRLLDNFGLFEKTGLEVIPVLKSNAYGHGLVEVASILNQADCPFVAVDGYFEAAKISDISRHRILVMGYILPGNVKLLNIKKCSFVVSNMKYLQALGELAKPVRIHLEINTGMNRMGIQLDELDIYLQALHQFPSLVLEGVMTHLADADNEADDSFTEKQVELFDQLVEQILDSDFKPKYLHVAQTAGSVKVQSRYADAVRIGIGLYGINPLSLKDPHYKSLISLQPVLELKSTVVKIINLKRGDKVSYNGIFTAPKNMKIGVLPLGYYEGIPRELGNVGSVTYGGRELPIVGRVCMNHTMIDLKDTDVKIGSEVFVMSGKRAAPNSIEQISSKHNLFSYTLLSGLSGSIRRKII